MPARCRHLLFAWLFACLPWSGAEAQVTPLGEGPWVFPTATFNLSLEVSVVARGINHPWGMAFLPSGNILVAERGGRFRLIRPGQEKVEVVAGAPAVAEAAAGGLMDIALHPDFANTRWVYFTYAKPGEPPEGERYYATTALARGRLNEAEDALTGVEDLFVAQAWSSEAGGHGARLLFAPDGTLFMSSPFRREPEAPQDGMSHIGKLLRLDAEGGVPQDNPFVGRKDVLPEIWSIGHRAVEGMAFHPQSEELWISEHGPQGGDEVNIIQAGANYGWPLATYGRDYDGSRLALPPWPPGMEEPHLIWVPSIAPSGTMFYTGEHFPAWRGNLFVGSLMTGRMPGSGHIQRIVLNEQGEMGRERLLAELKQRVRDVRQGPDGLLYVLTEERDGALLKISPVQP